MNLRNFRLDGYSVTNKDWRRKLPVLIQEHRPRPRHVHCYQSVKAGYRPELAWTCCDYADALLQRSEPGNREKAMSLLDESLAISSELGMRPLMERVLSRQEILRA